MVELLLLCNCDAKHIQMSQTGSEFTKSIYSDLNDIHMLEQHNVSILNNLLNVKNKNILDKFIGYHLSYAVYLPIQPPIYLYR